VPRWWIAAAAVFRPYVIAREGDGWQRCSASGSRHEGVGEWGYRSSDESAECYGCGARVPVTVLSAHGKAYGIAICRHERVVRKVVASRPTLAPLEEGPLIERPGRGGIVMGDDLGDAD